MELHNKKNILVAGVSGVMGRAIAGHFLKSGHKVFGIVRKRESVKDLEPLGLQVKEADFTIPETLDGICKGMDVVIPAVHAMLGKGKNVPERVDHAGHLKLISEAAKAGVKHFIYPSIYKASPDHMIDFFRIKFQVEQAIGRSGVPYTIFRLPAFMEWHAWRLIGLELQSKGKVSVFGSGNNPINFIGVRDIVQAVDLVMLNPEYFGQIINLSGPDNLSRNEVASMYAKAMNKPLKVSHMPVGVLKVMSPIVSIIHPGFSRIMKFAVATELTNETLPSAYSISRFGLKPTYIQDFIKETASGQYQP